MTQYSEATSSLSHEADSNIQRFSQAVVTKVVKLFLTKLHLQPGILKPPVIFRCSRIYTDVTDC